MGLVKGKVNNTEKGNRADMLVLSISLPACLSACLPVAVVVVAIAAAAVVVVTTVAAVVL